MGDDIDDEIRKAQLERTNLSKAAFSAKSISFDEDFYGSSKGSDAYSSEINDDDEGPVIPRRAAADGSKEAVRKSLNSYTAPKHLLESRPRADPNKPEEDDPFKEFKRTTVAEREDEYRARWRKRKLSPPRVSDPFKGGAAASHERSYKDIMMEQQLDRENKELKLKIQKRKAEEDEERKQDAKAKNGGTGWDLRTDGSRDDGTRRAWSVKVSKNGQGIGDPIGLNPAAVFTIGRERTCDIALDHPSCSKQHAYIKFQPNDGNVASPHIFDKGSTNGSFLNGTAMEPARPYEIKEGDVVKFGGSTREYKFSSS